MTYRERLDEWQELVRTDPELAKELEAKAKFRKKYHESPTLRKQLKESQI